MNRKRIPFFLSLLGLLFLSLMLSAQSRLDSMQHIDSIVVKAQRTKREVIPSQKLEGEELKKLNSLTVADALRYFSGIQLKDYGGVGGLKTVNIRSMGTNHTGVFYDGFQLGNAQNGQVDLGKFSLDNMETISLYNGQKSEIFQSARDFGAAGSIYLTSRQPVFHNKRTTNLRVGLKAGSFGLLNPSIRYEHKLTEKISTTFSSEWINADGKYKFRYRRKNVLGEVAYDTTATRHNGDINATRMEVGLNGQINGGNWRLSGYNYNSERGMPGAIVNNVWRRGERLWDRNTFLQGTLNKTFFSWWQTMGKVKYASDFTHYVNNDDKLIRVDNSYRQKEFYASAVSLFKVKVPWWDVSLAYDFQWNKLNMRNEALDSTMYDFPFPSRFTHMVSTATAFHVGRLKGQASLLGTFVQNHVKRHKKAPNKNVFTPAIFLSYAPFPNNNVSVRTFYKQSFRMPTFNDLYYTDMGNANLKPEHVTQYNIGLLYEMERQNALISGIRIALDAYYNEVKDKIIAYPKGQQFRWTMLNLGYVEIRGIDASVQITISPSPQSTFTLKTQYTYQKAQDFTSKTDNFYSHQIPYIPWHSGSAIASATYSQWNINYSFIYVGERYNQQENIRYNHTQPWYTSDISVARTLLVSGKEVRLMAEVNNLLSQDYDVILNYPMPKRNYRLSITLEL